MPLMTASSQNPNLQKNVKLGSQSNKSIPIATKYVARLSFLRKLEQNAVSTPITILWMSLS